MSDVCSPPVARVEENLETAFARYIAEQWSVLTPPHHYQLSGKGKSTRGRQLTFGSLREAELQYEFKGTGRAKTVALLAAFTRRLQELLGAPADSAHALHHLCLEVLEWGGVEGTSSQWLRERCDEGALASAIVAAVNELAGPSSPEQLGKGSVFASETPMNSGMTKIFALAAPARVVIYDGRVGAALGFLAKRFLGTASGQPWLLSSAVSSDGNKVPECLRWGWSDGQGAAADKGRRNPSSSFLKFPPLRSGKRPDRRHAEYVWRASRVLREALTHIPKSEGATLHMIERALFMIGYDVRGE